MTRIELIQSLQCCAMGKCLNCTLFMNSDKDCADKLMQAAAYMLEFDGHILATIDNKTLNQQLIAVNDKLDDIIK